MALETLEIGYQKTEENEAIKKRLIKLYTEVAEIAMEKGNYEEEQRANERIAELRNKSEELEETESEREYEEIEIAQSNSGEEGITYFELGFSPEDFTVAGYSIMDGSHIDDIEQAAAEIMPQNTDTLSVDYVGWCYGDMPLIDGIELSYYYLGDITGVVGYEADGSHFYVGYF